MLRAIVNAVAGARARKAAARPDLLLPSRLGRKVGLTDSIAAWERLLTGEEGGTAPIDIHHAYKTVGWFRRGVKLRALALADIPYTVRDEKGEIIYDSDQENLPDPDLEVYEDLFLYNFKFAAALATSGYGYVLKETDEGQDLPLRWLSPKRCEAVFTASDGFVGITYRIKTRKIPYAKEDLVYVFEPDPYVEEGPGSPDALAARVHADVLDSLETWADRHLDRGLVKQMVVQTKGDRPSPEEEEIIKERIRGTLYGKGNAGEVSIWSDQIMFNPVGEGIGDFRENEFITGEWKATDNALGVPHSLQTSGASNYAEKEVDLLSLYLHQVFPDARIIQRAWNRHYFRDRGLTFRFERQRMEVVQNYQLAQTTAVVQLVSVPAGVEGRPLLSRAEGREYLGFPAEDGDSEAPPAPSPPAPEDTAPPPPAPDETAQEVQPVPTSETTTQAKGLGDDAWEDLRRWRRKVARKGRRVAFDPDYLDPVTAEVIQQRLDDGLDLDDVFSPPFDVGF